MSGVVLGRKLRERYPFAVSDLTKKAMDAHCKLLVCY